MAKEKLELKDKDSQLVVFVKSHPQLSYFVGDEIDEKSNIVTDFDLLKSGFVVKK